MTNRFNNPNLQFADSTGAPYAGGFLYFYVTATTTPLNTYNDPDLAAPHVNSNPVTLDSAGRAGAIFLQELAYKVVLKDSALNTIWTMDPVSTDFTPKARLFTYAGNPNTNVAGTAGSASTLADTVYDRTNNLLYICTTTGVAAAAVWTQIANVLSGAVSLSGVITPTALAADTNNWAPTGFSATYQVRASSSAAYQITGLAGGSVGREILLTNIGSFDLTLIGNSGSSSAGNLFVMNDMVLGPAMSVTLYYDGTSAGWRLKAPLTSGRQTLWIPAGAMVSATTNGAAIGTVETATNKVMFITKDFDTTTQEFAQFSVRFPKSWNKGTVTFQPVWSHTGGANFGVTWGLAGVAISDDDAGDVAFGTAITSVDTGGTNNDIYIGPESTAVTIAGTPQAGDLVYFRVNRTVADAGDTLTVDARLHGISLYFSIDASNDF